MNKAISQNLAWINGQWNSINHLNISLADRSLTLGDGIFETILIFAGRPQLLSQHYARWQLNAELLGMAKPPSELSINPLIKEGIQQLSMSNGVLRLNWSRGNNLKRGISLPEAPPNPRNHKFWLELNSSEPCFETISTLISNKERRNAYSLINQCKSFNYLQAIQTRREAQEAGFDEGLLLSTNGEMCCGTISNLLIYRSGEWLTPRIESGCMPGIMRGQGIKKGFVKEEIIQPMPEENDQWVLINSLSCKPIKKVNRTSLKTLSNPNQLWMSLIE